MKRLLVVLTLAAASLAAASEPLPKATGYVTDTAGLLSPQAVAQIDQQLRTFDQQSSTQVVVVTVPTLNGEPQASYTNRLFREWGVGQKGTNNGVLLLVTKTDRKIRIEVGRGLEGALPDATAKEIVDTIITPELKQGHFDAGIGAGATAILAAVKGEFKRPVAASSVKGGGWPWWVWAIIIVVIIIFLAWATDGQIFVFLTDIDFGSGGGGGGGGGGDSGFSGGGGDSGGGGADGSY